MRTTTATPVNNTTNTTYRINLAEDTKYERTRTKDLRLTDSYINLNYEDDEEADEITGGGEIGETVAEEKPGIDPKDEMTWPWRETDDVFVFGDEPLEIMNMKNELIDDIKRSAPLLREDFMKYVVAGSTEGLSIEKFVSIREKTGAWTRFFVRNYASNIRLNHRSVEHAGALTGGFRKDTLAVHYFFELITLVGISLAIEDEFKDNNTRGAGQPWFGPAVFGRRTSATAANSITEGDGSGDGIDDESIQEAERTAMESLLKITETKIGNLIYLPECVKLGMESAYPGISERPVVQYSMSQVYGACILLIQLKHLFSMSSETDVTRAQRIHTIRFIEAIYMCTCILVNGSHYEDTMDKKDFRGAPIVAKGDKAPRYVVNFLGLFFFTHFFYWMELMRRSENYTLRNFEIRPVIEDGSPDKYIKMLRQEVIARMKDSSTTATFVRDENDDPLDAMMMDIEKEAGSGPSESDLANEFEQPLMEPLIFYDEIKYAAKIKNSIVDKLRGWLTNRKNALEKFLMDVTLDVTKACMHRSLDEWASQALSSSMEAYWFQKAGKATRCIEILKTYEPNANELLELYLQVLHTNIDNDSSSKVKNDGKKRIRIAIESADALIKNMFHSLVSSLVMSNIQDDASLVEYASKTSNLVHDHYLVFPKRIVAEMKKKPWMCAAYVTTINVIKAEIVLRAIDRMIREETGIDTWRIEYVVPYGVLAGCRVDTIEKIHQSNDPLILQLDVCRYAVYYYGGLYECGQDICRAISVFFQLCYYGPYRGSIHRPADVSDPKVIDGDLSEYRKFLDVPRMDISAFIERYILDEDDRMPRTRARQSPSSVTMPDDEDGRRDGPSLSSCSRWQQCLATEQELAMLRRDEELMFAEKQEEEEQARWLCEQDNDQLSRVGYGNMSVTNEVNSTERETFVFFRSITSSINGDGNEDGDDDVSERRRKIAKHSVDENDAPTASLRSLLTRGTNIRPNSRALSVIHRQLEQEIAMEEEEAEEEEEEERARSRDDRNGAPAVVVVMREPRGGPLERRGDDVMSDVTNPQTDDSASEITISTTMTTEDVVAMAPTTTVTKDDVVVEEGNEDARVSATSKRSAPISAILAVSARRRAAKEKDEGKNEGKQHSPPLSDSTTTTSATSPSPAQRGQQQQQSKKKKSGAAIWDLFKQKTKTTPSSRGDEADDE